MKFLQAVIIHVIFQFWFTLFYRSKVNTAVYQKVLEHSILPSAEKLYDHVDFPPLQDFRPVHSAKTTTKALTDRDITVFNGFLS